jgi:uncharacterized protein (UPF0548 family)
MHTLVLLITFLTQWCISDYYVRCNDVHTNDLIWKFIWKNKPNQEERSVCRLNDNEEGVGMINIDNFVKSKQIQFTHVLPITLLTQRCISDQYVRRNDECTHLCY